MVGVDIHVGDALQAVHPAQRLDGDAAIVEHTETRRAVAPRMVQAGDRHERMPALIRQQARDGIEHTPDDITGGLINTRKRGRIPEVEVALAGFRLPDDPVDVCRGVETLEARPVGGNRRAARHPSRQSRGLRLFPERAQPIRAERMTLAEAVTGQFIADVHTGICRHAPSLTHAGEQDGPFSSVFNASKTQKRDLTPFSRLPGR